MENLTNRTSNTVTNIFNTGFSGPDSLTYKATDGQGVSSNIATVTITVNADKTISLLLLMTKPSKLTEVLWYKLP